MGFIIRFNLTLAAIVALALPGAASDLRVNAKRVVRPAGEGGRLSWSTARYLIAYDKVGSDGFYDIYTMLPDGSQDKCVTCDATQLPGLNIGSPRWHPSGNWLVFVAQRARIFSNNNARPGVGAANDVWIADATLTNFWKLADTSSYSGNGGVLHPTFSNAGDKLFWVERSLPEPVPGGTWTMKIADFQVDNGTPRLANVRQLDPPGSKATFYESHDFTPDDTKVIFSGNLEGQATPRGMDIYMMDITKGTWVNLTNTPTQWDEHAHVIPEMNKIVWMSSTQTYGDGGTAVTTKTEYWTMDLDGSNKHKLSWFNDARSAYWHSEGGGVVADFDFNADASQMLSYVISDGSSLGNTGMNLMLDLEVGSTSVSAASFFRPPLAAASYLSVFGNNLATAQEVANNYPTALAGTSATVTDARGESRAALLVFVSPGQVNLVLPDGLAPGPADLTITNGHGQAVRETFTIEEAAPSLFAANQNGDGPAAALWQMPGGAPSLTFIPVGNTYINTPIDVRSGNAYLVLYGTGIRGAKSVQVSIGGVAATVSYAGAGGGYLGLDQVNVLIPSILAGRNTDVVVNLTADGAAANPVTIGVR